MEGDVRFGDPKLVQEPVEGSLVIAARDAAEGFEQDLLRETGSFVQGFGERQRDFFAPLSETRLGDS